MSAMLSAIKSGGNLRKTPGAPVSRESSSNGSAGPSSGGGGSNGGFAEIMRKNREAAARRAGGGGGASGGGARPTPGPSSSPAFSHSAPSTPRTSVHESAGSTAGLEERLASIESKLDKIMAHLGIS